LDILRQLILVQHVGLVLVESRLQRNKLAHSAVDLREARRGFAELPTSIAASVVILLLHRLDGPVRDSLNRFVVRVDGHQALVPVLLLLSRSEGLLQSSPRDGG
jgi:hypothetical protein